MKYLNVKLTSYDYFLVQSYMINDYHLKGLDLIIYAIIDGYSQAPNQWFEVNEKDGVDYLRAWTGETTFEISMCLDSLVKRGLIVHQIELTNDDCVIHKYRTK